MKLKLHIFSVLLVIYSCQNKNTYDKIWEIENENRLEKIVLNKHPVKSFAAYNKLTNMDKKLGNYIVPTYKIISPELVSNIFARAKNNCIKREAVKDAYDPIFKDVLIKIASDNEDSICAIIAFRNLLNYDESELKDTLLFIACNSNIFSIREELFNFYFPVKATVKPNEQLEKINLFSKQFGQGKLENKIKERSGCFKYFSDFYKLSDENEINSFIIGTNDYQHLVYLYSIRNDISEGARTTGGHNRINNILLLNLILNDPLLEKYFGPLQLQYRYSVTNKKDYGDYIQTVIGKIFSKRLTVIEYTANVQIFDRNNELMFSKNYTSRKAGETIPIANPPDAIEKYIEIIDFSEVCKFLISRTENDYLYDIALNTENKLLFEEILYSIKADSCSLKNILINRKKPFKRISPAYRLTNPNYSALFDIFNPEQLREIAIKGIIPDIRLEALSKLDVSIREDVLIYIINNDKDSKIRVSALIQLSNLDPVKWNKLFINVLKKNNDCELSMCALNVLRSRSASF